MILFANKNKCSHYAAHMEQRWVDKMRKQIHTIKVERTSDTVNGSHNVSLPIILKKIKVGQLLQSSCISSL